MKVVNYNEFSRKYFSELKFLLRKNTDVKNQEYLNLFYELYDGIKNDSGIYDYLLGLIFETAYLVNNFSLKLCPEDNELLRCSLYLKSFSNIQELKEKLTISTFDNFLEDVTYFYDSDLYYKRNVIECSIKDKDYLMSIFPCFLIDAFSYLNRYDVSMIIYEYQQRLSLNDEGAFNNTVKSNVEDLINLEQKDFSSYKYILLEMLESYYKYKKYLFSNNILMDEYDVDILSMVEDDLLGTIYFSVNNIKLLYKIVSGYLECNLLSKEELSKINDYNINNNKKNFVKVMKKSYKLKNEV